MSEQGWPRRMQNYHMRSQPVRTEPADYYHHPSQHSHKITYDVGQRMVNLQKQQYYRSVLDEQVIEKNRMQTKPIVSSYSRPHEEGEPPMTTYTDTIPYSPYSRDNGGAYFKRELQLNREREIQEMNQIRRDITNQLNAVKVFDYGSAIPEEERLGFSRYYSQHQRPKETSRPYHSPYTLQREDSGRIQACLDQCEALLGGLPEERRDSYSSKKYGTIDEPNPRRRIRTEGVGSYPLAKYDSINPNLFRLPELPIKKRPQLNNDAGLQLSYPKRANFLKQDRLKQQKDIKEKPSRETPTGKKQAPENQYPKPRINLIEQHQLIGSDLNEEEQADRNQFLAVKPQEPFQSNIHIPTSKKQNPSDVVSPMKNPPTPAKLAPSSVANPQTSSKKSLKNSEALSDVKLPPETGSQPTEQPNEQPKLLQQYTDSPVLQEPASEQKEADLPPDQPIAPPTKTSPSRAGQSRASNTSVLKLQDVPMTPRSKSKMSNHDDIKSEHAPTKQKQIPAVGGNMSAIHFSATGDTVSTMQSPDGEVESGSEITLKGNDIVSYLMRVKARGSKLYQRIKEHKEALRHVRKQDSLEESSVGAPL